MAITFNGLSSGLDTDKIITDVVRFSQRRIDTLKARERDATNRKSIVEQVQEKLIALQTQSAKLARTRDGVFDRRAITSSNESLVKAAAGSAATSGVQSLRVLGLARAHQVASQGFDDPTSQITPGSFQIKAGNATATITIDSTNNTLKGLAQAINNAGVGVTATIINDGSDSRTQPYRLLLSSNKTGTDNAITITNNLANDGAGSFRPNFNATHIGNSVTSTTFAGTSSVASNSGAGSYTGSVNDLFTFTVQNGGTVGTDNGLQVAYSNADGSKTGTLTINQADAGVAKSVVDGVQVQFGAGTLVNGDQFTVDVFAPTLQAAENAKIQLGSGAGAIVVQSATNQVTGLIRGVTLSLQAADPTKEVTLTVTNDVDSAKQEILDLVNDFNDFVTFLNEQTKFDPTTGIAGPLQGNRLITSLRDQVQQKIVSASSLLPTEYNRLSVLGITSGDRGKLVVNESRLTDVLNGGVAGIGFAQVKSLFTLQGQSSNGSISFVSGSQRTKESSTPYQIDITQAAEQATITAGNSLANSIAINGTNDELVVRIDETTSGTIKLTHNTYTPLSLSKELESQIDAVMLSQGRGVQVSLAGQTLVVNSDRYGAGSEVTLVSGSALSTLGFAGTATDRGQEVAGSFLVNGVSETATGNGQILTGSSANANTADLAVLVSLTSSQVQPGSDGDLTVTHGLASRLNNLLDQLLDRSTGRLKTITDRLGKNIDDAKAETQKETQALDDRRAALLRQFASMEQTISRLKSSGEFVTNAFSSLLSSQRK